MPIRAKFRPQGQSERQASPVGWTPFEIELPNIEHDDSFRLMVKKLSIFIADAVYLPSTFEQLRTTSAGESLRTLVEHLSANCTNPAIVNALLALRWHYSNGSDDKSIGDARANACEIVAWRFLTRLSEREAVEFCLYEIPDPTAGNSSARPGASSLEQGRSDERTALLSGGEPTTPTMEDRPQSRPGTARMGSQKRSQLLASLSQLTMNMGGDSHADGEEFDPTAPFISLNALEIAAVADAKRFLSQHIVQKIITGIWSGEIVFWDTLSVHSEKLPRFYNPHTADPFSRLRVPKYLKTYEIVFFGVFLCLYYGVLIGQNRNKLTGLEVMLYIWFAAFFYDEVSEYIDAGSIFYAADVWNLFDMVMLAIGITFAVLRFIGYYNSDDMIIDIAFDVLSLEALFMVPRICSVLSLSPYWGTLIPCLKEMGKDFLKFMVLVIILYCGFLTTFSLIGRTTFSFPSMAMIVTKIFFGSSYVGFDIMNDIDPIFGPPLMLIFVTLSSILLMGSLTGMLSNSFSRVISHAREEYLFVYSVYVLEASTSNRLTHFYPPFNLLAFVIFRPLRLFLPSDSKFRQARILLLKATHLPIVGAIELYELVASRIFSGGSYGGFRGPQQSPSKRSSGLGAGPRQSGRLPSPYRPNSVGAAAAAAAAPTTPRSTRPVRKSAMGDDDTDAPTDPSDVDGRIDELSAKIDRLTALVTALQPGAGIDAVRE